MHIRVSRDALLRAFSHGQSVIEKRTTLIILGHTLIKATQNSINLVSTDMDLSLSEVIGCEVLQEGAICIPTILVYDILRKLKSGVLIDLNLEDSKAQVVLTAGRSKFEIPCVSDEDFPKILQENNEFECNFKIPAPTLKNMLDTIRFAMSTDEMRYSLNGVNFSCDVLTNKPKLRAAATDRHQLACIEIDCPEGAEKIPSVIIGKKAVTEISKLLEEATEPVKVSVSETRIEIAVKTETSRSVFGARLVDGSFPEYDAILNIEHNKKLIATTTNFVETVDRVGTIISDKTRIIKLSLSRNLLECSAATKGSGTADEDLDVDFDCDETVEIYFDSKNLIDIASHINDETFEINLTDADTAVYIKPINIDGVHFALMPLNP